MKRRLIALVSAALMLASLIPLAAVSASAKEGGAFPWIQEKTLVEQILERDGLIDGIWYPWINAGSSGHNLTGNDLMAKNHGALWARVELDYHGADAIYREIYNLKAMGYNMMAWGGSIYGEGVIFDEYGDVIGIKQEYLDNTRRLLDICREVGMPVMWNIYFHSSSCPDYYSHYTWSIIAQMLGNPEIADHYAQRFVAPLCEVLAEYPDVVAMISIADEPEGEINDAEKGDHFEKLSWFGVNLDDMFYFMGCINDVVKEKLPGVPRTVSSNDKNKAPYRGFDLDLMGNNIYSSTPGVIETEQYVTYADALLAEYNIGGEFAGNDAEMGEVQIQWRKKMMEGSYKGGFQWCWMPDCSYVNDTSHYLLYDKKDNTSFRETSIILRHYMDDYRAEHRGETIVLDKPVLLANDGTGVLDWVPSRQATAMDLLRSDDGGKTWKKLLDNVNPDDYLQRGMGTYRDTDPTRPADGFMYKVVVRDDKGNTVESEPNDPAGTDQRFKVEYTFTGVDYPTNQEADPSILKKEQADLVTFGEVNNRPYGDSNLIVNGGFEAAEGGQWNNTDFLGASVQVVTDPTAPEGEKSLFFNTVGNNEGSWYKFKVTGLKPNTNYVFSTWIKGSYLSAGNLGRASTGTIDHETGQFMIYWPRYTRGSRQTSQVYPNAWDGEWHLRSVMFETDEHTDVEIGLYGYGSEMWLDDMAVFENGNGIKYSAGKNDNIGTKFLWDAVSCVPADSLTDVTVDGKEFWQSGDGWKQGFMSVAESKYGYGNSLQYTASANPHGLYYLKWIDVKPNTKYYVSFDFKILESGAGRIVMMDNQLVKPSEFYAIDLDAEVYGSDWFAYTGEFNSGAHDKVAFGILDLGGSCLVDNIRLFEAADNAPAVKNLYTYTNKVTNNVTYGKEASVTARAEGDGLKYKWYFKDKGASKFSLTTSMTGKTYSVKMNEARDGRQVYCVITDKYGTSRKTATTTLAMKKTALKITTQPKTANYAKNGATVKATVKAQGDGLKYTWYVKNDGAKKYTKSSVTSATYSVKMADKVKNRRVYCVITDAYGKKVQTKTAILRMSATITTQPKTTTVKKNATAKLTVKAKGDGLKYTWYIKNSGSKKYTKSSVTKSTYTAKMTSKVKNRQVYCVVTDKYGNKVQTKTVKLKMK